MQKLKDCRKSIKIFQSYSGFVFLGLLVLLFVMSGCGTDTVKRSAYKSANSEEDGVPKYFYVANEDFLLRAWDGRKILDYDVKKEEVQEIIYQGDKWLYYTTSEDYIDHLYKAPIKNREVDFAKKEEIIKDTERADIRKFLLADNRYIVMLVNVQEVFVYDIKTEQIEKMKISGNYGKDKSGTSSQFLGSVGTTVFLVLDDGKKKRDLFSIDLVHKKAEFMKKYQKSLSIDQAKLFFISSVHKKCFYALKEENSYQIQRYDCSKKKFESMLSKKDFLHVLDTEGFNRKKIAFQGIDTILMDEDRLYIQVITRYDRFVSHFLFSLDLGKQGELRYEKELTDCMKKCGWEGWYKNDTVKYAVNFAGLRSISMREEKCLFEKEVTQNRYIGNHLVELKDIKWIGYDMTDRKYIECTMDDIRFYQFADGSCIESMLNQYNNLYENKMNEFVLPYDWGYSESSE